MARSNASSRVRWATVIEKVLIMMKIPTNSAIPAKPSRKYVKNRSPSSMLLALSAASSSPVRTVYSGPSTAAIASRTVSRSAPGATSTDISL